MELMVVGVSRLTGTGKESGRAYDFAQLLYLKPIDPFQSNTTQLRGFGFELGKADLANEQMEKFAHIPFPCRLEIETDTVPSRNGFRTVIVGFKQVQKTREQQAA